MLLWAVLLKAETCGSDIGNKGVGEPCTRRSECIEGLDCKAGICTQPMDGGPDVDGAARDAAADGA